MHLVIAMLAASVSVSGAQIPVRHREGLVHGFLVLRSLRGEIVANGDLIQNVRDDRVTTRLVFHFKDGSLYDDTTNFSQHRYFQLISDHLILRGPAFKHPLELNVDGVGRHATVRYSEDGKEKTAEEDFHDHSDLANGLVLVLLKNIHPEPKPIKVGMVVPTPKPRLVELAISAQGEEAFTTGNTKRKATRYVVKIELTGLSGVLAPLLGKEPPDTHVWILEGEAPAFIKSEGSLEAGGPVLRTELASPVWASPSSTGSAR
jgi:hypothetical protein